MYSLYLFMRACNAIIHYRKLSYKQII